MKSRKLKTVILEDKEGLICFKCGETKNVEYNIHGENLCNKCALVEEVDYEFKTSTN